MPEPTEHLDETDERPWEEPGSCRMDCEPHRGPLLLLLGTVSLVCGCLSVFVIPVIIGLPLGLVIGGLAASDLKRMNAGLIDPNGREPTEKALSRATYGLALNAIGVVCSPYALVVFSVLIRIR